MPRGAAGRTGRQQLLDLGHEELAVDAGHQAAAEVVDGHVSSGTFYRYFNDKAEILGVLRDEALEAISTYLVAGVVRALDHDLDGGVREIVVMLVDSFERHRAVILAMVNALPAGSDANILPEVEARLFQLASVLPRRHLPGLSPQRMEAVVFMSRGVLVSTCLRVALMRPYGIERDEGIEITAAMITAGLRAG